MDPESGLGQDHFDVIVIGTGLSESIVAAGCAKHGLSVLHLDENEYYGDRHASLTVQELIGWVESHDQRSSISDANARASVLPLKNSTASSNDSWYASFEFPASVEPTIPTSQATPSCKASTSFQSELPRLSRQYALSLFPSVLPSRGPLIETLIDEDVGKYVNFRLVDGILVYNNGNSNDWADDRQKGKDVATKDTKRYRKVPGSKDQIFKDGSLSLLEKRRLMKFLMEAAVMKEEDTETLNKGKDHGETNEVSAVAGGKTLLQVLEERYSLPLELAENIAFAIAFATNASEPSEPALHRLNRYLRSAGRYGPSPFLVAQFGGVGEITQSFCRACAVHGGTYILGAQGRASRLRVLPLVEGEGENSDQDRKGNDNQQAKENEDEDDKVQVQVQVQGQDRTNRPRVEVTIPAQSKPITASHLIMPNTTSSRNILTHAGVEFPSPIQSSSSTTSVNLVAILPALPSTLAPYLRQKSTNADEGEDGEENEPSEDDLTVDAAFVIFPPTSDQESVVRCLLVGEGTGSCPAGQYVLYLQAFSNDPNDQSPKSILAPYLSRLIGHDLLPLFSTYYLHSEHSAATSLAIGQDKNIHLLATGDTSQPGQGQGHGWLERLDQEAVRAKEALATILADFPTQRAESAE